MKKIYTLLVAESNRSKVESIFNTFRIGMNDWDVSKVFEVNGLRVINYTIMCDEETYTSIVNILNRD